MKYVALVTLTLYLPAAMADEIYRWVDADGVVNYTQRKPEGSANVQRVETRSGSVNTVASEVVAPSPAAAESPELTPAQQEMLDDLERAEADRQTEVAKIRSENCEKAREVLEKLTVRSRIRVVSDDGTTRIIPEEERQERISEAQQAIATNCA